MALVEASHYTDEDGLRQQVGQYSVPQQVTLQRGGLGKLALAFVAAIGSGAAMYFAVTSGPTGINNTAQEGGAPGDSIVLTMSEPVAGSEEADASVARDLVAANQLALLAGAIAVPEPEVSFVGLGGPDLASGMISNTHSEPSNVAVSKPEPSVVRQEGAAKTLTSKAVAPEDLVVELRIPEPRHKPQHEPQPQPVHEPVHEPVHDQVAGAQLLAAREPLATKQTEEHAQLEAGTHGEDSHAQAPVETPTDVQASTQTPASRPHEPVLQTAAVTLKAQSVTPVAQLSRSSGVMLNAAPWARITERSPNGLLPVTGPAGEASRDYYARPFPANEKRPRISIVIGGLGLSQKATAAAIDNLPPDVTLAFAPYGKNLQTWINKARGRGHEVLLELPMEPFDYPANDPGPYTLLTNNNAAQNTQRLNWLLAQFNGYVGVTNYLGAKFTSTPEALLPVLRTLDERGLLVLDDGTSNRSLVPSMARKMNVPYGAASRTIDMRVSRAAIDDALLGLEDVARRQGSSIGMGYAYPVSIDRILLWVKTLEQKGFVLAPVSANVQSVEKDTSFDPRANSY